eukprot:SAG22_NODE_162_length_16848_cov_16.978267_15_plen_107_part_00
MADLDIPNPVAAGAAGAAAAGAAAVRKIAGAAGMTAGADGADAKAVDLDAVVVKDYFRRIRPHLQNEDGSPKLVVTVSCRGAIIGGIGMVLSMPHAMVTEHWYICE